MTARVEVEYLYTPHCPTCSWSEEPTLDENRAYELVHAHNDAVEHAE